MATRKLKLKKKLQDMRSKLSQILALDKEGFYFSSRVLRLLISWSEFRFELRLGRMGDSAYFGLSFNMPVLPRMFKAVFRFVVLMYTRYYRGPKYQLGLRLYIPNCSTAKTIRWISIGDSDTPFFYHTSANCKGYPEDVITRWLSMQNLFRGFADARARRLIMVRSSKRSKNKRGR